MDRHRNLTTVEVWTLLNALRRASEAYRKDAELVLTPPVRVTDARKKAQALNRAAREADELAEALQSTDTVTLTDYFAGA